MTATRCAATTRDGSPCQAQPAPDSPFCPFHDPDRAAAFAQGRSKGGAASHRRPRRFPRVLDYRHVAELLGELFVDALNQADVTDPRALSALNQLARTLLLAVGHPRQNFIHYEDRAEPAPEAPHLLRVYGPAAPDGQAQLVLPSAPDTTPDPGDLAAPPAPAPEPELSSDAALNLSPSAELDAIVRRLLFNRVPGMNTPELDAWLDRYAAHRPGAVPPARTPDHQEAIDRLAAFLAADPPASRRQARPQAGPQAPSQADNKPITSHPATSALTAPATLSPTAPVQPQPPPLAPSAGPPRAGTVRAARSASHPRPRSGGAAPAARRRR